jgi:hypothetical protein
MIARYRVLSQRDLLVFTEFLEELSNADDVEG